MYDAISASNSERVIYRRRIKHHEGPLTAASYGVRHGLIADPSFPSFVPTDEGYAVRRRHQRIEARFRVRINGGVLVPVSGNVSEGGAMFVLARSEVKNTVELVASVGGAEKRAKVEVVKTRSSRKGIVHHVRFADLRDAAPVWKAISNAARA